MDDVNRIEVKISSETKNILENYDAEKLLSTVPNDIVIRPASLNIYSSRVKLKPAPVLISLSTNTYDFLNGIASNLNVPISLIFNFLIETVADCGKIQPKKIAHALEDYYKLVVNHDDPVCGPLLNKILEEYGNSGFYDEETGLSEEGIANFLTLSEEGKNIIREIDKLRGIK